MTDREKIINIIKWLQGHITAIKLIEKDSTDILHAYKIMGMRKAFTFVIHKLISEFDVMDAEIHEA